MQLVGPARPQQTPSVLWVPQSWLASELGVRRRLHMLRLASIRRVPAFSLNNFVVVVVVVVLVRGIRSGKYLIHVSTCHSYNSTN